MKFIATLVVCFLIAGCSSAPESGAAKNAPVATMTTKWKQEAAGCGGISVVEVDELMRAATESQGLPVVSLFTAGDGVITVLLSKDPRPHGGMAVHFEKIEGKWVIKEAGPWWE